MNEHVATLLLSNIHGLSRPPLLILRIRLSALEMNIDTMGSYQQISHNHDPEQPHTSHDPASPWKPDYVDEKQDLARRTISYFKTHINQIMTAGLVVLTLIQLLAIQRMTKATTTITSVAVQNYTTHRSYGADWRYMSLENKYDELWNHELVADNGIINLPPYDSGGKSINGEFGAIAMLHALHCLGGIRKALQTARNDAITKNGHDIGLDPRADPHWPHCFHYLRQMILCHADDTIERGHFLNGTFSPSADDPAVIEGSLDVRQCRDSERLFEMRRQHSDANVDGVPIEW